MYRNKAENIIPNVYCFLLMCSYLNDFKYFKNQSITYVVLFLCSVFSSLLFLLLWLYHMRACFACLFPPYPFLFCSSVIGLLRPLSLPGNFWSVRTPWHSGSGIRVHLLLHDFPKNPSLSAAWYVLRLKVLCRCSRILSLVFLELSTRGVHIAVECLTPPRDVKSRPVHFAPHFLLCLASLCGGAC